MKRKITMYSSQTASIQERFQQFLSAASANGFSERTLKMYRQHLHSISKHLDIEAPLSQLTKTDLEAMVESMRTAGLAHNSISSYLRVFKSFLSWCKDEGYMDLDYYTFTLTQDSSILVGVFPEDYKSDDYIMAVISDSNDTSIVGTTSYNVEGSYMGSILGYQLKAGKYYLTILSSKDSSKYNGAKYGCYFEAIPSSGNSGQSTGGYSSGSLNNFKKVNNYTVGQFKDVPASKWCAANVQTAYEYMLLR